MSPVHTLLVEVGVMIVLIVLTALLTSPERAALRAVRAGMTKTAVLRRLGPPTRAPLTAREVIARVSAPVADDVTDDRLTELWLYENTPKRHDTRIVLSRRGVVASIAVTPTRRPSHAR